jgi:hypothetical protein
VGAFYWSSTVVKILFADPIPILFKVAAFPFVPPFFGNILPQAFSNFGQLSEILL